MIPGTRVEVEWTDGEIVGGWLIEAPAVVAGLPSDLWAVALDGEWSPRDGLQHLFWPEEVKAVAVGKVGE